MKELKLRIKEVKKNYENLPKAKSDEGEFVIIAEKDKGGGYEQYKECLGIQKNGCLVWSFLSGCSCNGHNDQKAIKDISAKVFQIETNETVCSFYERYKLEPYEADYCSY